MCKCLAFVMIYAGIFVFGLIQGQGQDKPFDIGQVNFNIKDFCCIGEWSIKPVWTLTYDASRDIVFLGSCGCVCMLYMSDPSNPKKIGEFKHSQCNTCGLFYQSKTGRLFICDGISGLKIWDIKNPKNPIELGNINTPGYACAVYVIGPKAYVADGDGGLRIIDVSNPSRPKEISHIDMTTACCVYVEGLYAYVADLGLRIIDISNPSMPKQVAFHPTPGVAYGVVVSENKAYIADDWCGIRVIDVSDIRNLNEIGFLETPGYAWDIQVSGSLAFVAAYDGGLRIIDVSDPAMPKEVAFQETSDKALQAINVGSRVYVAAAGKGLLVYGFGS
jgi:hypothetical protein